MEYAISLVLICLSALFSGLTLGLLSLDAHTLKRQMELGNKDAKRIYPIRKRGNLLLTTLLLGNVAVNTALSIFLGTIASGLVAGIVATALIFVFGEIIPQAVISRHAMRFGAATAPFVQLIIWILLPITYPIAWILDKALGEEMATVYSKNELKKIISEHEDSTESDVDEDEERILHGALEFSNRTVREVMTPKDRVKMYARNAILDEAMREALQATGLSRFPVFIPDMETPTIVGMLYYKDVLTEPEDASVWDVCEHHFLKVDAKDKLDKVLAHILKHRQHLCVVYENLEFAGVISLEDIIEEVIQQEIIDEDDVIVETA